MEEHDYTQRPRRHLEYPELTMYQLLARTAAQYPDAPAYEFYKRRNTYTDLMKRIERR